MAKHDGKVVCLSPFIVAILLLLARWALPINTFAPCKQVDLFECHDRIAIDHLLKSGQLADAVPASLSSNCNSIFEQKMATVNHPITGVNLGEMQA